MLRLLLFLVLVAVLAAGIAWFSDKPGGVVIDWAGWHVETSAAVLLTAFALVLLAGVLLQRVWTWLMRDFLLSPARRAQRRQSRGLDALNRALVALAAGDRRESRRLTRRAVALLPPQPLTHMLAAEAARLGGDAGRASEHYRALAAEPDTAFLGLRGLIEEARTAGQDGEALRLAEEAAALRPDSEWAQRTLFSLQVGRGQWAEAEATLKAAAKRKLFPAEQVRRHQGALSYCRAVEAEAAGNTDDAAGLARRALDRRPGFVPAAVLLARLTRDADKLKEAGAVITRAWGHQPHPDLAALFLSLHPNERASERYRRVKALAGARPDHWLSLLMRAEAAAGAEHFADARFLLGRLEDVNSPRVRALSQAVAAGRRPETPSRWLPAPDGPPRGADEAGAWVCATCRAERRKWVPSCPSCRRFDSFDWQEAAGHAGRSPAIETDAARLITAGGADREPPPDAERA